MRIVDVAFFGIIDGRPSRMRLIRCCWWRFEPCWIFFVRTSFLLSRVLPRSLLLLLLLLLLVGVTRASRCSCC